MERPTNSEGIPLDELFSKKEIAHLSFEKWLHTEQQCEITEPQTSLTEIIPFIHVIDTASKASLGEFFDRHKRRGPYKKGA